jgi:hypothetical protein
MTILLVIIRTTARLPAVIMIGFWIVLQLFSGYAAIIDTRRSNRAAGWLIWRTSAGSSPDYPILLLSAATQSQAQWRGLELISKRAQRGCRCSQEV